MFAMLFDSKAIICQQGLQADNSHIQNLSPMATLDQIDTIIIVMMENRSFDHLLG